MNGKGYDGNSRNTFQVCGAFAEGERLGRSQIEGEIERKAQRELRKAMGIIHRIKREMAEN